MKNNKLNLLVVLVVYLLCRPIYGGLVFVERNGFTLESFMRLGLFLITVTVFIAFQLSTKVHERYKSSTIYYLTLLITFANTIFLIANILNVFLYNKIGFPISYFFDKCVHLGLLIYLVIYVKREKKVI